MSTRALRSYILGLKAAGHSVILSTHIMQEVQAVCDRVIIINNGCKAIDARLDELQSEARLLLATDREYREVKAVLDSCPEVESVILRESKPGRPGFCYGLTLTPESNSYETAARVAEKVQEQQWPIYALHPETRDLETVFAEIHASGGGI